MYTVHKIHAFLRTNVFNNPKLIEHLPTQVNRKLPACPNMCSRYSPRASIVVATPVTQSVMHTKLVPGAFGKWRMLKVCANECFGLVVVRWFEVGCAIWADEPNWCQPNQSTYRQHLPKVCLQHFHGQDEDWFRILRTLLVHFGLGIMCEEGICQIWIFGFLRSKGSILEVQKKWGMDV